MNIFTVAFFGHRIIDNPFPVEQNLEKIIRELLHSKEYVEFLVGRDGDFDQLVSSTVRRCKRAVRDDNSALVWVMPYETTEYRDNEQKKFLFLRSELTMKRVWHREHFTRNTVLLQMSLSRNLIIRIRSMFCILQDQSEKTGSLLSMIWFIKSAVFSRIVNRQFICMARLF